MKKFTAFFLSLFFAFSAVADDAAAALERNRWEGVLGRYREINSLLGNVYQQTTDCTEISDERLPSQCSFSSFCEIINGNSGKPYLYVNSEGGKIPNYRLGMTDMGTANCFARIEMENNRKAPPPDPMTQNLNMMKAGQRARIELLRTVQSEGWQENFLKFESTVAEFNLEQLEQPSFTALTREKIQADITAMETRAGVQMPQAIRQKYTESLETMIPGQMKRSEARLADNNPFTNVAMAFSREAAGTDENVEANQARYQTAVDRAVRIFNETKTDIIKVLDRRALANPETAARIEQMKQRINTISYNVPPNEPRFMGMVCPGPNAFYNGQSHSFTLCPQIMEFPDSGLKSIIAHELGHSIDPCTMSQPLMKVVDAIPYPGPTEQQMNMNRDMMRAQGIQNLNLRGQESPGQFSVDFLGTSESNLRGSFSSFRLQPVGEAVLLKDFPYPTVLSCLSSEESLGARSSDKETMRSDLNNAIARMESTGVQSNNPQYQSLIATRNNFENLHNNIGACSMLPGNSQMQEAFSDWIAGEVIGDDMKETPGPAKLGKAFESFGFFLSMECQGQPTVQEREAVAFMKSSGCIEDETSMLAQLNNIQRQSMMSQDVHSHGVDRVEKVFVSQPEIKAALGCEETAGGKHCE